MVISYFIFFIYRRVSKSCANFHFWVNYPFKYNSDMEESVTTESDGEPYTLKYYASKKRLCCLSALLETPMYNFRNRYYNVMSIQVKSHLFISLFSQYRLFQSSFTEITGNYCKNVCFQKKKASQSSLSSVMYHFFLLLI